MCNCFYLGVSSSRESQGGKWKKWLSLLNSCWNEQTLGLSLDKPGLRSAKNATLQLRNHDWTVLPYAIAVAIWRQDSAQRRQDAAQRRQWLWSCFSHSAAQRALASAQTWHSWACKSELRAINRAQISQVSAQSRQSLMYCAIICTTSPLKQASAQVSHSRKQSRQFWIQVSSSDWWDWAVVIVFYFSLG